MNAQLAVASHGEAAPAPVQAAEDRPNRPRKFGTSIAGSKRPDFVFNPTYSSYYIDIQVTFNSHAISLAFARTFQKCQFALYELEASAPIIATDEEKVAEVMRALDKSMNRFESFLGNERAKATKLLEDNGKPVSIDNDGYTSPRVQTVRILSPRSRAYVDLLSQADELIGVLNRLWFEGFSTEVNMKRAIFKIRTEAVHLARSIWDLHTRSILALRRERTNFERQKQEARDEAERRRIEARLRKADELLHTVDEHAEHADDGQDMGESDLHADHPATAAKTKRKTRATTSTADEVVAAT